MSYELNERESIMAESGVLDIAAAFADTERWRIVTEAKHALDFYSKEERKAFLDQVEKWRGAVGHAGVGVTQMKTRDPSLDQAVDIVRRCITQDEKKKQIAWMAIRFGEEFAKTVEERAKK
jgi:hypothetical protein